MFLSLRLIIHSVFANNFQHTLPCPFIDISFISLKINFGDINSDCQFQSQILLINSSTAKIYHAKENSTVNKTKKKKKKTHIDCSFNVKVAWELLFLLLFTFLVSKIKGEVIIFHAINILIDLISQFTNRVFENGYQFDYKIVLLILIVMLFLF